VYLLLLIGLISVIEVSIWSKEVWASTITTSQFQYEKYLINNVPFIQASCNGQSYGEINLSITNGEEIVEEQLLVIYPLKLPKVSLAISWISWVLYWLFYSSKL